MSPIVGAFKGLGIDDPRLLRRLPCMMDSKASGERWRECKTETELSEGVVNQSDSYVNPRRGIPRVYPLNGNWQWQRTGYMLDGVVEVSPTGSTLFNQLVIKVVFILGFTQDTVASISARRGDVWGGNDQAVFNTLRFPVLASPLGKHCRKD